MNYEPRTMNCKAKKQTHSNPIFLSILSVIGGLYLCRFVSIRGSTQWFKKAKNGTVWDNFGSLLDKFGVILDNLGVVWDYFGSINTPINRIFSIENAENSPKTHLSSLKTTHSITVAALISNFQQRSALGYFTPWAVSPFILRVYETLPLRHQGMRTVKTVSSPGTDCASTVPACWVMILRAMVRPSPAPTLGFVV